MYNYHNEREISIGNYLKVPIAIPNTKPVQRLLELRRVVQVFHDLTELNLLIDEVCRYGQRWGSVRRQFMNGTENVRIARVPSYIMMTAKQCN